MENGAVRVRVKAGVSRRFSSQLMGRDGGGNEVQKNGQMKDTSRK